MSKSYRQFVQIRVRRNFRAGRLRMGDVSTETV